jgi:hypothetical protein
MLDCGIYINTWLRYVIDISLFNDPSDGVVDTVVPQNPRARCGVALWASVYSWDWYFLHEVGINFNVR